MQAQQYGGGFEVEHGEEAELKSDLYQQIDSPSSLLSLFTFRSPCTIWEIANPHMLQLISDEGNPF